MHITLAVISLPVLFFSSNLFQNYVSQNSSALKIMITVTIYGNLFVNVSASLLSDDHDAVKISYRSSEVGVEVK